MPAVASISASAPNQFFMERYPLRAALPWPRFALSGRTGP